MSKRVVVAILIVLNLFLLTESFGHAGPPGAGTSCTVATAGMAADVPCENCPCSDGQGSGCCDSSCNCHCPCPVPLLHRLSFAYAPFEISRPFAEPYRVLPQVYLTIDVPPQNPA